MTTNTKMLTATEHTETKRDTFIALKSSPEVQILSIKVAPKYASQNIELFGTHVQVLEELLVINVCLVP